MCTSHVCAHRTLQRVPLNTRYSFKQSSMLNGVGKIVRMSLCARVDVFIELSNGPVKRDIRSLLHWKQVLRTNAASSAKQLSAQVLCGVCLNCSYVAMCACRCVHRTIKRSCDAIYEACCTAASSAKQLSAKCCLDIPLNSRAWSTVSV